MPLYDVACPACDWQEERLLQHTAELPLCPTCGHRTARLLSLPARPLTDAAPYYDHGLGAVITSRAQRRALMRAQGVVEKGTTHRHGAKGTIFSAPGRATTSVPPSGAYTGPRPAPGH